MKHPLYRLCITYLSHCKTLFFLAFACGGLYGLMSGLGLPLIFEKVFRKIFEEPSQYSTSTVLLIACMVPSCFLLRGFFGYLSTLWMNRCGLEILTQLRTDIFKKLQQLDFAFFNKKATGDILHRIISDPKNLQDVLLEMASESIKQPLQMFAAFISLIYLSIKHCDFFLFIIFFLAIPLCFLPVRLLRSRVKNCSRQMQKTEAQVTDCVAENLRAAQEIRVFNLEQIATRKIISVMQDLSKCIQDVIYWQKMQQPMMEVVSSLIIAVIFIYAYFQKIPFSVFSAMGMALYFAFDPIKKITNIIGMIQKSTGSIERIFEILRQPITIMTPSENACYHTDNTTFVFKNVYFNYPEGRESSLKNIHLEIQANKFYALVGPSGAGKSTFIKLLPRLYDATRGLITFGGVPLQQWDISALRHQISLVSQSTVLFNDSILNNLKIGRLDASDDEVIAAAKMAYAHDFILSAGGYDTVVGENGNLFSGGQRQRLAIARALLKNAPVLILDEATSSLDSESEFSIQKALESITQNKTVIAIAHRISTIQKADCIFAPVILQHFGLTRM